MRTNIAGFCLILAVLLAPSCHDTISLDENSGSVTCTGHSAVECGLNSGWPCTCDRLGEACDDGNLCSPWYGICVASCPLGPPNTCPGVDYTGAGLCMYVQGYTGNESFCFLTCEADCDCPPDQFCIADAEWSQDGEGTPLYRCDPCETFPDC